MRRYNSKYKKRNNIDYYKGLSSSQFYYPQNTFDEGGKMGMVGAVGSIATAAISDIKEGLDTGPKYPSNPLQEMVDNASNASGGIASGISNAFGSGVKKATNQLENQNFSKNFESNEGLMDSWDSINFLEKQDIHKGAGWANLGLAALGAPWLETDGNGLSVSTDNLQAFGEGATAGAAGGPWGALIGGIVGGTTELFGRVFQNRNKRKMNDAIEDYNNRQLASFNNAASNLATQNALNAEMNYAAYGGYINTFDEGGMLPEETYLQDIPEELANEYNLNAPLEQIPQEDYNEVKKINNGGRHEENPHGGVPMGVDQQGTPNLVEEGEIIWGDYVFSDRIKADENIIKKYKIPSRLKNKTYAQIAKRLQKESEEMPNDPITKRGLMRMMKRLQESQEEQKYLEEIEKMKEEQEIYM